METGGQEKSVPGGVTRRESRDMASRVVRLIQSKRALTLVWGLVPDMVRRARWPRSSTKRRKERRRWSELWGMLSRRMSGRRRCLKASPSSWASLATRTAASLRAEAYETKVGTTQQSASKAVARSIERRESAALSSKRRSRRKKCSSTTARTAGCARSSHSADSVASTVAAAARSMSGPQVARSLGWSRRTAAARARRQAESGEAR
mmetsp:Transcript_17352/g.54203  ORF Transcript_17352/g.54203 Transcript_17352/m.54203 type:complete len:207 (+) Transcript_17352:76-696(+)